MGAGGHATESAAPKRARIFVLLLVLVLCLAAAGCGNDNKNKASTNDLPLSGVAGGKEVTDTGPSPAAKPEFELQIAVDKAAGPAPLKAHFQARALGTLGDVLYRWRFDDGTSSIEQNPTHVFKAPGYYFVFLDARDSQGFHVQRTFFLGSWPKDVWAAGAGGGVPLGKQNVPKRQATQWDRTNARRAQEVAKARLEAKQRAQLPN